MQSATHRLHMLQPLHLPTPPPSPNHPSQQAVLGLSTPEVPVFPPPSAGGRKTEILFRGSWLQVVPKNDARAPAYGRMETWSGWRQPPEHETHMHAIHASIRRVERQLNVARHAVFVLYGFKGPWWCSGQTTRSSLRRIGFDSDGVAPRILACGNITGRCRWSAGFRSLVQVYLQLPEYHPDPLQRKMAMLKMISHRTTQDDFFLEQAQPKRYALGTAVRVAATAFRAQARKNRCIRMLQNCMSILGETFLTSGGSKILYEHRPANSSFLYYITAVCWIVLPWNAIAAVIGSPVPVPEEPWFESTRVLFVGTFKGTCVRNPPVDDVGSLCNCILRRVAKQSGIFQGFINASSGYPFNAYISAVVTPPMAAGVVSTFDRATQDSVTPALSSYARRQLTRTRTCFSQSK
ncbi:hypothetical protein PR048_026264 [Dryococelus australis]|uniref:Uncharacterized protein n=1 Tax=Dryococelus australis TaxID=614101 RepID=A0ABQ9GKU5_9NEOP|nr:hypothetical protein PR048_026264 [Dryococelus australis]